jgi:hypothetical protein
MMETGLNNFNFYFFLLFYLSLHTNVQSTNAYFENMIHHGDSMHISVGSGGIDSRKKFLILVSENLEGQLCLPFAICVTFWQMS